MCNKGFLICITLMVVGFLSAQAPELLPQKLEETKKTGRAYTISEAMSAVSQFGDIRANCDDGVITIDISVRLINDSPDSLVLMEKEFFPYRFLLQNREEKRLDSGDGFVTSLMQGRGQIESRYDEISDDELYVLKPKEHYSFSYQATVPLRSKEGSVGPEPGTYFLTSYITTWQGPEEVRDNYRSKLSSRGMKLISAPILITEKIELTNSIANACIQ